MGSKRMIIYLVSKYLRVTQVFCNILGMTTIVSKFMLNLMINRCSFKNSAYEIHINFVDILRDWKYISVSVSEPFRNG